MDEIDIQKIAEAVEGKIVKNKINTIVKGVSIDSRKVNKGDLFIAINGKNNDGHRFINMAIENGCNAVIISKKVDCSVPAILVDDTSKALMRLSKYYRELFNIPVIAVTGSTGKTSTKEMIWYVLSQKYNVHKTEKNYNNEIGLPLTLLDIKRENEMAVIEMGMSHFGEIKRLSELAEPNIAVITNIGTAHIENLGSRENIFKAKMEVTAHLNKDDLLIVNGDDDYLKNVESKSYTVKKISLNGNGDYNAENIINLGEKGVEFSANYMKKNYNFRINVPGLHNVYNALSAIAVAEHFKLAPMHVINGIADFRPCGMRMNIIPLNNGIKIINDTYNANVDSMKAAIDVLNTYKNSKKICILGDMLELGDYSEKAHREIGKYILDKADIVVAIGKDARYIAEETKNNLTTYYFKTKEEAYKLISKFDNDSVILIKGSRGMKMEDITNYIVEHMKR